MAELKPKSFRIDDETAEKFKEIANKIGGNQQETLSKLIEAYEFQSGKAILTEKKPDIEQFEKYINAITRMFMGSLEDNQNITNIVRTEFDAFLKSKDTFIQDLQERLSILKEEESRNAEKSKLYMEENKSLHQHVENLEKEYKIKISDMQKMLEDKDSLNKALTISCNDLKNKISDMNQEYKKIMELSNTLDNLMADINKLKEENRDLIFKNQEDIFKLKEKHNEEISSLKEKHFAEIDKYQQGYRILLEQSTKSKYSSS